MSEQSNKKPGLVRVLGLREGISLHMGVIIGSGIFKNPDPKAEMGRIRQELDRLKDVS